MAKTKPPAKPDSVPESLKKALTENRINIDSGSLLNDIIDVWGGGRKIANDLHTEFQNAATGGMVKQKITELIVKLIINNTDKQLARVVPPSELSDADLVKILDKHIAKATGDGNPTTKEAG
jgi:hypothetical protein